MKVSAQFNGPNEEQLFIPAFWNSENRFKLRFAPTAVGTWRWTTLSSNLADSGLQRQGTVMVFVPDAEDEDYEGRWFDLCSGAWRKGEGAYAPYGSGRVWRTQTPKGLDTIAATSEERFYVNLGGVVTITELSAVTATSVTFTWSWL